MSAISATVAKVNRLTEEAIRRHRGPKLWLLSPVQLEHYEAWQARQSEQIAQFEAKHGPGAYYGAYLNGEVEHATLPSYLKRALQMTDAPTIAENATLAEVYRIYEDYRS